MIKSMIHFYEKEINC